MSINTSLDSSSSSYSTSKKNPNPNPNHGFNLPKFHIQTTIQNPSDNNHDEIQISNNNNIYESSAPAPENTTIASSRKVNELSECSGKKVVTCQHNNSRGFQCGGGATRYREKSLAETVHSPHQQSLGPGNSQPSTIGRKNQAINGNHLLNFHYNPISRPKLRTPNPPPQRRHHKRKPYNKDLFLQANYKFVLLDSGVHSLETLDPDKMLIWEDIVCVKFTSPCPVLCPICLDVPLCPQITSCGHIFCFPCILRYFLNSEDDHKREIWKKCPLCFEMISSKDLYTIYIEKVRQHSVGDTVEFMLLTRQKDSCVLSVKNKEDLGTNKEGPDLFSKFTFTSDVDLSVRNAVSDLDSWLAKADSGMVDDLEKLPYVCAAMEQLEQRRKYWNERKIGDNNMPHKCNDAMPEARGSPPTANYVKAGSDICKSMQRPISGGGNVKLKMVVGESSLDRSVDVLNPADNEKGVLSSLCEEMKGKESNYDGSAGEKEKDSYNFYQAVDGQYLILHPLNLKCLLHHYGSYDMLPHRINGTILQLETVTQSEAMRRRYRYISHFSLTTTLQLCEIDLTGSLPLDALFPFMDEIKNREIQRKRLAKKERQEKIKADAAADAALANEIVATLPHNNITFYSQGSVPTFSMDDFEALGGGSTSVVSSSPPLTTIGGEKKMHFANVARLGFAAGHDSPALRIGGSTLPKPKSETTSSDYSVTPIGGMMGKNGGTPSFANVISRAKDILKDVEAPKTNETAKKGKKATRVLLSTGGGRRY